MINIGNDLQKLDCKVCHWIFEIYSTLSKHNIVMLVPWSCKDHSSNANTVNNLQKMKRRKNFTSSFTGSLLPVLILVVTLYSLREVSCVPWRKRGSWNPPIGVEMDSAIDPIRNMEVSGQLRNKNVFARTIVNTEHREKPKKNTKGFLLDPGTLAKLTQSIKSTRKRPHKFQAERTTQLTTASTHSETEGGATEQKGETDLPSEGVTATVQTDLTSGQPVEVQAPITSPISHPTTTTITTTTTTTTPGTTTVSSGIQDPLQAATVTTVKTESVEVAGSDETEEKEVVPVKFEEGEEHLGPNLSQSQQDISHQGLFVDQTGVLPDKWNGEIYSDNDNKSASSSVSSGNRFGIEIIFKDEKDAPPATPRLPVEQIGINHTESSSTAPIPDSGLFQEYNVSDSILVDGPADLNPLQDSGPAPVYFQSSPSVSQPSSEKTDLETASSPQYPEEDAYFRPLIPGKTSQPEPAVQYLESSLSFEKPQIASSVEQTGPFIYFPPEPPLYAVKEHKPVRQLPPRPKLPSKTFLIYDYNYNDRLSHRPWGGWRRSSVIKFPTK